jgi:D-lyxose ketol-isomerase
MKRSEINEAIKQSKLLLEKNNFRLPSFAYWTIGQWKENKDKISILSQVMQGWDITDFGSGNFKEVGAVLFTIRNGDINNKGVGTPYAEKIIILQHEEGQKIPMHCHRLKTEDIVNRGGGILIIQLYSSDANGEINKNKDVEVYIDGIKHRFKAGEIIEINQGDSITLTPYIYHAFWAKKGAGDLILGEVSTINDDNTDNVFTEPASRFSEIEEDEAIIHPLVNEYKKI